MTSLTGSFSQEHDMLEVQSLNKRVVELPIDIHEYIIGFLDNIDNATTIANCTLVCRAWLHFSRFKLYYVISLHSSHQWASFERLVLQPPLPLMRYFGMIRELQIQWENPLFYDVDEERRFGWEEGQARPWAHLAFQRCASQLHTGLTRFIFRFVKWTSAPDQLLSTGRDYRSLTALKLYSCMFLDILQLQSFVTSFPVLAELTLESVHLQSPEVPSNISKARHSFSFLEVNCFYHPDLVAISNWLARAGLVHDLVHLIWGSVYSYERDGTEWTTIMEAIHGPSLEELYLCIPDSLQENIAQFSKLRKLTLDLRFLNWIPDGGLATLNQTLSGITSNQLEELCVVIYYNSYMLHCTIDTVSATFHRLAIMDVILAGPQFHSLRNVKLEYCLHQFPLIPITPIDPSASVDIQADQRNEGSIESQLQLINDSAFDGADPRHPFRAYVESVVRSRILRRLSQLHHRGLLDVLLDISLMLPDAELLSYMEGVTKDVDLTLHDYDADTHSSG